MKHFLFTNTRGSYLFDEDLNILSSVDFPREKLQNLSYQEITVLLKDNEKKLLESVRENPKLRHLINDDMLRGIINLNRNPDSYPNILADFIERFSNKDFFDYNRNILLSLTKSKLRNIEEDKIIIQHVETLEQVTKVFNILVKRIREYYSMKSPELLNLIEDNRLLIKLLSEKTSEEILDEKGADEDLTLNLNPKDEEEIKLLVKLAEQTVSVIDDTKELITMEMENLMPHTSETATPLIGAKLLTLAGSFKKLAVMPSSRIQLLGAEKALFRHLKQGVKPPKYGVLYQHPDVLNADKKLRGKAARKIASKIAISVREDYFGKRRAENR